VNFDALRSDGTAAGTTAATQPELRYGPVFDQWSNARSFLSTSGGTVSPKSALTLTAYYAAINVLATDLACLPRKIYRRRKSGGRDEVTDDVRSDLLGVSPDGETTAMRWMQAWLGHTLGHGNGYTEIEFSGGEISGLYLLDPATAPDRRAQDKRLYYRLDDGTTRPPYKILHLAGLGYDGLCGYSVARYARSAIELGLSAQTFGNAFFANGTQASGHFELPHKMDKEAQDQFRASVNAVHQGAANAFKFMVLTNGMKWVQTTIPPEDAQFLATRQFQVLEIARMFRLPPHKIGDYSQSHLANIEQANIDYMTTTLMPWCESIEQELNRKLFTRAERAKGFYVEHLMNAFLRGDMASRAAFYAQMLGLGVYTPNRIAELENENPMGPDGDERFLTVQAQPFKTVLNPPKPAPAPAPAPGANPAEPPPAPRFSLNGSHDHAS
jgi:HK97 family phage portal protein